MRRDPLGAAGWLGANPVTVCPAADRLGVILILPLALLALTSGVVQALITHWGLLRYWWVLAKLALTVSGVILALFVLLPDLHSLAAAALAGRTLTDRFVLVQDASGASVVLIVTVLLAYLKPFGRLRPPQRRQPHVRDDGGVSRNAG